MEKSVIIINGTGGAGKDTLCELAAKHYKVKNISSITPIKEIAAKYGWNGEKDSRSRKFLSDLKRAFVEYNDLPTRYLSDQYHLFLKSEDEILFVHIREGEEIDKFKDLVKIRCVTLLVDRKQDGTGKWGNVSDDAVREYPYDYFYHNNNSLMEAEADFVSFIESIVSAV